MQLPSITHPAVGRTPQPNYTHVTVGDLTIAFSYTTPVGFHYPGRGWTVRENDWGPTTGRHLNHLDDGTPAAKRAHLDGPTFDAALAELAARLEYTTTTT